MSNESPTSIWIYYRIFLQNPADFASFVSLLAKVVSPIIEQFENNVAHFHFFYYSGEYKTHLERELENDQGIIERLKNVTDDEPVAFIRLRFLVDSDAEPMIRNSLLNLIEKCGEVRGYEQPTAPYGIEEDLENRFGVTRLKDVMQLIESASRLALSYAKSDEPVNPPPRFSGGPAGLVHLVANTLQFNLVLGYGRKEWGQIVFVPTQNSML